MKAKLLAAWAASALLGATAHSASAGEITMPYPRSTGIELMTGWDTVTGEKAPSSCVVAAPKQSVRRELSANYTEVVDSYSFASAFSMSTSAQVASIFNTSGSFGRDVKLATSGLNIAADIRILTREDYLVPKSLGRANSSSTGATANGLLLSVAGGEGHDTIHLTPEAALLVKNPKAFRKKCGDSFVSTIRYGAGLYGAYVLSTQSYAERKSWAGKIGGSYGPFSGDAAAQKAVEQASAAKQLNVSYYKLGAANTVIPTTDEGFQDLVRNLDKSSNLENSSPYEMGVTPYSALPNYTRSIEDQSTLTSMAKLYQRIDSLAEMTDEIRKSVEDEPTLYFFDKYVSRDDLGPLYDALLDHREALKSAIAKCRNAPQTCEMPSGYPETDYTYRIRLPVRSLDTASGPEAVRLATLAPLLLHRAQTEAKHSGDFYRQLYVVNTNLQKIIDNADSRADRLRIWVADPNSYRCHHEHDTCLKASDTRLMLEQMKTPAEWPKASE